MSKCRELQSLVVVVSALCGLAAAAEPGSAPPLIRSARSGAWSAPATWEGGKVPGRRRPRPGPHGPPRRLRRASPTQVDPLHPRRRHADASPPTGTRGSTSASSRSSPATTPARTASTATPTSPSPTRTSRGPPWRSARPDRPIDAGHTALIRLAYVDGMDKESCPAIVCCGGRMDFHGAPLSRTWVKLGATREGRRRRRDAGRAGHRLEGRRPRHRHRRRRPHGDGEDRIDHRGAHHHAPSTATKLTLDQPLDDRAPRRRRLPRRGRQPEPQRRRRVRRPRRACAATRCTTATRPARSATPSSATSARRACSAATACTTTWRRHDARQLRHRRLDLGQRQPLADHPRHQLPGRPRLRRLPERRPRLLPRRRHRGLQRPRPQPGRAGATRGKPLPKQVLPFDDNEGAGFWWANSLNTFTRNVACENDQLRLPLRGDADAAAST